MAMRCIVLTGLLWVLLPTAVFGAFLLTLPPPDPPPRWRAAASRRRAALVRWWKARRPAPPPEPPDPFAALRLQVRLGVLAEQIRLLENDPRVWARGRRLQAAWAAYDALLGEACGLAGVDVPVDRPVREPRRDDGERFREEMELASRGWSW